MIQHKNLSEGRWQDFSLMEQMANIGSEVSRALTWRNKANDAYAKKAINRALELIDLTLDGKFTFGRYRELCRLREALVDYFYGTNEFASNDALWLGYFNRFNFAARKGR
jgi:hypothetical protein